MPVQAQRCRAGFKPTGKKLYYVVFIEHYGTPKAKTVLLKPGYETAQEAEKTVNILRGYVPEGYEVTEYTTKDGGIRAFDASARRSTTRVTHARVSACEPQTHSTHRI